MPDDFVAGLVPELIALRRELHATPELSGHEVETAARLAERLAACAPQELLVGVGGNGLLAVFGETPGPTWLLRCDLDALPIPDAIDAPHRSQRPAVGHKCGHDGHATLTYGVARWLAANRPHRGRVLLLFQPAEETGTGAERVLADPVFARFTPDAVFALHNLPGLPAGAVVVRDGPFAAGSVGLVVELHGATAHAAYPEQGRSPALALAELINELTALPQALAGDDTDGLLLTVIHARLGEVAFGTTPGEAQLMATLRAGRQAALEQLRERAVAKAEAIAAGHGLAVELSWREPFPATVNDAACVTHLRRAGAAAGLTVHELAEPFRWSEDFGAFTARFPGALFGLGAGERQPPLHHPAYDFPDVILGPGLRAWIALLEQLFASASD